MGHLEMSIKVEIFYKFLTFSGFDTYTNEEVAIKIVN